MRISSPMRPVSMLPSGAPLLIMARARCTWNCISSRQASSSVALRDVRLAHAEPRHFVQRQVDAADGIVLRDILPEIDELQAGADGIRVGDVLRRGFLDRDAATSCRPDWRSGGSSPAVRRNWRSVSSPRPARTHRADHGTAAMAARDAVSLRRGSMNSGVSGVVSSAMRASSARNLSSRCQPLLVGHIAFIGDVVRLRAKW